MPRRRGESYSTQVDAQRRADPRVETIPGQGLTLRWWTDAENGTLTELMTAAGTAQAELRAALLTGPGLAYETVQALKAAAREA